MTELDIFREKSIIHDKEKLYEVFFLKYSDELWRESNVSLKNAQEGDFIVIIDCKAFPMIAHLSARDFIDAVQSEEAQSTQNHKCYFCNYEKDDEYVTFMKGFLEAHKSCEQIVRSNLQDFVKSNNDIFTANII